VKTEEQPMFSVVSPVYGCSQALPELCHRISSSVEPLGSYEIILVYDCSTDDSWKVMQELVSEHQYIKCLRLSRNFGQHYAITAGLEQAVGEWVVVMDCDLQDQPEEIPRLYERAQEGYDSVCAQRAERQDGMLKKVSSRAFYKVLGYMTDTEQDASIANFGIYHRRVIDAILSMGDHIRYFPAMVQWVGFKRIGLPVKHTERGYGKSSYSLRKLFLLAFDNIIAFSDKPLRLTVKLGAAMALFSLAVAIFFLIRYSQGMIDEPGFTSLIISIWFIGSVIVFVLGVVGIYIGYVFDRVKGRPTYIVQEILSSSSVDKSEIKGKFTDAD